MSALLGIRVSPSGTKMIRVGLFEKRDEHLLVPFAFIGLLKNRTSSFLDLHKDGFSSTFAADQEVDSFREFCLF